MALQDRMFGDRGQQTFLIKGQIVNIFRVVHQPGESGVNSSQMRVLGDPKSHSRVLNLSSVTQSCPTLCDPVDYSVPGVPVHHQLLELAQTHVH